MPRSSKTSLGQILPGFWIGRMAAVRAIFEFQDTNNQSEPDGEQEEWTVITVMSSNSIISTVADTLKEEKRKFGRDMVTRHEIWDLPDKPRADFVSDRLVEILTIISNSIDTPPTRTSPTNQKIRPRRNCLVHCARGVSRSAAVCAAWLISCGGYTLPESLDMIRSVREVNPNLGFLAGLRAIEQCDGDIQKAQQRLAGKRDEKKIVVVATSDEVSC